MSNQNWNGGQGGYPQQGGQGGYPQGGQGGYQQGGQGGYPQGGQGGYPQQGGQGGYQQGGYPQQGQGGYQQAGQGYQQQGYQQGYGAGDPGQGGSGGGGSKLPLIIGGALLVVALIGVLIFFLTRPDSPSTTATPAQSSAGTPAGGESTPAGGESTPAGGESTPAGGESTPAGGEESTPAGGEESTPAGGEESTPAGEPASDEIDASRLPASIGEWKQESGFGVVYYTQGEKKVFLLPLGTSDGFDLWTMGLQDQVKVGGDKGVCGTAGGETMCVVKSNDYGDITFTSVGTVPVPVQEMVPVAEEVAKAVG